MPTKTRKSPPEYKVIAESLPYATLVEEYAVASATAAVVSSPEASEEEEAYEASEEASEEECEEEEEESLSIKTCKVCQASSNFSYWCCGHSCPNCCNGPGKLSISGVSLWAMSAYASEGWKANHPLIKSRSSRPSQPSWPIGNLPFTPRSIDIDSELWQKIDPVEAMASFYLLSHMEVVDVDKNRGDIELVERFQSAARYASILRSELVATVAPIFALYVDIAVGGELRHHSAIRASCGMDRSRSVAWREWLGIREQLGPQILLDAAKLFEDGSMARGFGGKPWGAAARLIYNYVTGKYPDWLFVDRVFTMQHNGGSLLNKVNWRFEFQSPTPRHMGGLELCQTVGDAHAANPPNLSLLYYLADAATTSHFRQWWKARNQARRGQGERMERWPIKSPTVYQDNDNGLWYAKFPPAVRGKEGVKGYQIPIQLHIVRVDEGGDTPLPEVKDPYEKGISEKERLQRWQAMDRRNTLKRNRFKNYHYEPWLKNWYLDSEGNWRKGRIPVRKSTRR